MRAAKLLQNGRAAQNGASCPAVEAAALGIVHQANGFNGSLPFDEAATPLGEDIGGVLLLNAAAVRMSGASTPPLLQGTSPSSPPLAEPNQQTSPPQGGGSTPQRRNHNSSAAPVRPTVEHLELKCEQLQRQLNLERKTRQEEKAHHQQELQVELETVTRKVAAQLGNSHHQWRALGTAKQEAEESLKAETQRREECEMAMVTARRQLMDAQNAEATLRSETTIERQRMEEAFREERSVWQQRQTEATQQLDAQWRAKLLQLEADVALAKADSKKRVEEYDKQMAVTDREDLRRQVLLLERRLILSEKQRSRAESELQVLKKLETAAIQHVGLQAQMVIDSEHHRSQVYIDDARAALRWLEIELTKKSASGALMAAELEQCKKMSRGIKEEQRMRQAADEEKNQYIDQVRALVQENRSLHEEVVEVRQATSEPYSRPTSRMDSTLGDGYGGAPMPDDDTDDGYHRMAPNGAPGWYSTPHGATPDPFLVHVGGPAPAWVGDPYHRSTSPPQSEASTYQRQYHHTAGGPADGGYSSTTPHFSSRLDGSVDPLDVASVDSRRTASPWWHYLSTHNPPPRPDSTSPTYYHRYPSPGPSTQQPQQPQHPPLPHEEWWHVPISLGRLLELKKSFHEMELAANRKGLLTYDDLQHWCGQKGIPPDTVPNMLRQVDIHRRGVINFWMYVAIATYLWFHLRERGVRVGQWVACCLHGFQHPQAAVYFEGSPSPQPPS